MHTVPRFHRQSDLYLTRLTDIHSFQISACLHIAYILHYVHVCQLIELFSRCHS